VSKCTCVSCGTCNGSGKTWFWHHGVEESETCIDCDGSGLSEECDYCLDRDWDPYEAAGESPFGLPGGGTSL
jgi:hypothetical protein